MNDKILLTGMEFYGHHGCSEEERQQGQVFRVDAELTVDLSISGKSDNISDTIDYVEVFNVIKKIVTGKSKNLIEAVAEDIAAALLEKFSLLETIKLIVYKPSAPFIGVFQSTAVSIVRSRN